MLSMQYKDVGFRDAALNLRKLTHKLLMQWLMIKGFLRKVYKKFPFQVNF